ncbi:MAG: hypothetical protein MI892_31375, partial [Desulfobacterales bacterium]|nr:hypothetical protein [Desulfobacterales bacterium]
FSLMGMNFFKGRGFDRNITSDQRAVVVNEAFLDFCGYTDSIVGQKIIQAEVIGILKNTSFNALQQQTEPLVFSLARRPEGYLNIKFEANPELNALASSLKDQWDEFFPGQTMEYSFLDNRVEMMYADDQKKSKLLQIFTLISIIISAMGFLNLASILGKKRIKEIGIRKVSGAKTIEIVALLNRYFVSATIAAFIIAVPISYYLINLWQQDFANKTNLSWWIFALAGVLALGIALLTVSWQSWKAATRNPVEALRYE